MIRQTPALRRELYAILLIKLVLISGLWWAFVRDARVDVDEARIARHLARDIPRQGEQPPLAVLPQPPSGENHAQ
jgi:hypothetical protein